MIFLVKVLHFRTVTAQPFESLVPQMVWIGHMVGCDLSGGLGSGAASLTVGYPAQAVSPQGSHRSTYEDGRGFFHCTFDFGVEAFAFRKPSKVGSPFMIMEALYVLHKRMSVGHGIPVPPQRTHAPPSCPKKDVSDTGIWLQVRQGALPNGKCNRPLEENWTMGIIPARGLSVAGFCPNNPKYNSGKGMVVCHFCFGTPAFLHREKFTK